MKATSKVRLELHESNFYGLSSKRRLAKVLGWQGPPSALATFSRRADNFAPYLDKKNPAKPRRVEAPRPAVKRLQKVIEANLKRLNLPAYLHSAIPGRSYLSNSQQHCNATGCTVTLDVSDFFPSVTVDRVQRLFITMFHCSRDIAEIIADLLCCEGHLATGSPASPIVSFLAHRDLFDRIDARAKRVGGVFTLYIDDIAVTGSTVGHGDIKWITRLLDRVKLRVKTSKTRLFRADAPKLVTGRAFRMGESRAPNRQHLKAMTALHELKQSPGDITKRQSAQGRLRHLALLDERKAETYRAAAKALSS